MIERIKELALQAGYVPLEPRAFADDLHEIFLQKFAELIVRECANICFSEAQGHNMAFDEHCGVVIKEHFGVE